MDDYMIHWYEALIMVGLYVGYVLLAVFTNCILAAFYRLVRLQVQFIYLFIYW